MTLRPLHLLDALRNLVERSALTQVAGTHLQLFKAGEWTVRSRNIFSRERDSEPEDSTNHHGTAEFLCK